jgi:hypothetical protein
VKNGIDHGAALPILSTYMGHSNIAETAKYLRLTPEAFPELTRLLESACGHIIPEIEVVRNETN